MILSRVHRKAEQKGGGNGEIGGRDWAEGAKNMPPSPIPPDHAP